MSNSYANSSSVYHQTPKLWLFKVVHNCLRPVVLSDESNKIIRLFQKQYGIADDGQVTDPFWFYFFKLAATFGDEMFGLLPVIIWTAFPLAPALLTNFVVSMLSCQIVKELFMLPRPLWKNTKYPVIKLEKSFDTEYGFPSTHTVAGVLPLSVLFRLSKIGYEVSPYAWLLFIWLFISVAGSRLYLGVHSLLDISGGFVIGLTYLLLLHYKGDYIDQLLYGYKESIWVWIGAMLLFVAFYPRPRPWTACFATSSTIFGTAFGAGCGLWHIFNSATALRDQFLSISIVQLPTAYCEYGGSLFEHCVSAFQSAGHATVVSWNITILRIAIAGIPAIIVKETVKNITQSVSHFLLKSKFIGIPIEETTDIHDRVVPIDKAYVIDIPSRLFSYASVGYFIVVYAIPIWSWAGLV